MMSGVRWMHPGRRSWLVIALVVIGLVAGWSFGGLPAVDVQASGHDAKWELPPASMLERYSADTFQSIKSSSVWPADEKGTGESNGSISSNPNNWTLIGVVSDAKKYALVMSDDKLVSIEEGGTLPGGGILKAVSETGIRVQKDGCSRTINLFSLEKDAKPGMCANSSAKNQSDSGGENHAQ